MNQGARTPRARISVLVLDRVDDYQHCSNSCRPSLRPVDLGLMAQTVERSQEAAKISHLQLSFLLNLRLFFAVVRPGSGTRRLIKLKNVRNDNPTRGSDCAIAGKMTGVMV